LRHNGLHRLASGFSGAHGGSDGDGTTRLELLNIDRFDIGT